MSQIAEEVKKTELFRDVPDATLNLLLEHASPIELESGTILLSPERANQELYLLLSGTLSLHFDSPTSPEIRELPAGVSVGEMSVIDDGPPSAYVIAKTACRVFPVHKNLLRTLVDSNPVARNLLRLLNKWIKANTRRIVQDRMRISELTDQANIDALTGLYNRRWINNALPRLLGSAQKDHAPLTILLIDVDHFKRYNDTQGHQNGDSALIALSEVLKTTARPYDYSTRYGGEEFLVLLQNTSTEGGVALAERLQKAVRIKSISNSDGAPLPGITISIGLATSDASSTSESLVETADDRLYRAKKDGRDCICYSSLAFPEITL